MEETNQKPRQAGQEKPRDISQNLTTVITEKLDDEPYVVDLDSTADRR